MMKCKAALTEAGGDMEKADRDPPQAEQGRPGQGRQPRDRRGPHRRLHRPGQQGRRPSSSCAARAPRSPRASCSSQLANDLAKQVAVNGADHGRGAAGPAVRRRPEQDGQRPHRRGRRPDAREHEAGPLRPPDGPARRATSTTTARVGVLLQVEGDKADAAAAARRVHAHHRQEPAAARREDVPAEVVAKETEIAQAADRGRPEEQEQAGATSSRRSPRARSRPGSPRTSWSSSRSSRTTPRRSATCSRQPA